MPSFLTSLIKPQMKNYRLLFGAFIYGLVSIIFTKTVISYIISTLIIEMIILSIADRFIGKLDLVFRYILCLVSFIGWMVGRTIFYYLGLSSCY